MSAAIDCSTKSRIREIKLPGTNAPKPLRTEKFPRGLPTLTGASKDRVEKDNRVSDYLLAIQRVINLHERGAFRENPSRSLHWVDPVEDHMRQDGCWSDFYYENCCFLAARKKAQTIRHNVPELRSLPNLVLGVSLDACA